MNRAVSSLALWSALLAVAPYARLARAQQIDVKAGVVVTPDTVRVGDPFRVTIGVRAPIGATIEFPKTTDSTSTVQSLDPVVVRPMAGSAGVEQFADYRVAAWDVAEQPIRLGPVVVKLGRASRTIQIADSVFVRTVLPADTTLRVPKPARPLYEMSIFPWWLWALIVAAIIAIGLLIWWWLRRRRRPPTPVIIDPFAQAESEFARIEALGLLDAGERGRHVTLMVEVLRDYLAARYAEAALSLTSTELQRSVRELPHVPQDRLTRLLTEADLIKFARRPVSTDRAREIGREARAIVTHEHITSQPPAAAGEAVAA
jgi:hypothetical protein